MGEPTEARDAAESGKLGHAARDLLMVLAGVVAMAAGATAPVDAMRRISGDETAQPRLRLAIVDFATGFEPVVPAWSAARRGTSGAMIAGVVGSFAHNVMMTLSAGALTHPLTTAHAGLMDFLLLMVLGGLPSSPSWRHDAPCRDGWAQSSCCLAIRYSSPCALRDDGYGEIIQHAARPSKLTA